MADKIVEIPNIGPVAFPEGMTDEQIIKAIQSLQTSATTPKAPESFQEKILNSPVGGIVRGLRDVPDAGAQLLTRGLEAISPAGSSMEAFAKSERQRVEDINRQAEMDYQKNWRQSQMGKREMDVGRIGGNILGTMIPATRAVQALGAVTAPVRAGAISGVTSGALQPVSAPKPEAMTTPKYFAQKVEQMGAGGVMGAGTGYLANKLTGALFGARPPAPATPAAQAVAQADATVSGAPTASVTGGGSTLGQVGPDPSAGLTAAQRAILERGKAMGFRTTAGQQTGSRSLQQMEARMESSPFTSGPFNTLKDQNQRVLNRATAQAIGVNADELSNPVLAKAQTNISGVYDRVSSPEVRPVNRDTLLNGIDLIDNAFEGLTTQPLKNNIFVKQLQDFAIKGEASGNQLNTLSSKIGKRAKNEMTTAMGDRELGNALFQVKEMVDDALAQTLSQADRAAFQAARNNYRNLMTIRSTQGTVNPSSGNVSGLNLASALTRKDPQGFVFGKNQTPMYEAARFAQAFRPLVGDSGTATRMMEVTPMNALLAAPFNVAARAYTSQPVANFASGLQSGLIPQTGQNTQEMLRRMLPVTGAAGLMSAISQ